MESSAFKLILFVFNFVGFFWIVLYLFFSSCKLAASVQSAASHFLFLFLFSLWCIRFAVPKKF